MDDAADLRHAWVERVLGVSLRARAVTETEERAQAVKERQRDSQRRREEDERAAYGEGYKPFDTRDVHAKLRLALDSGTMISSSDWTDAAQPLTTEQREQLLADRETMQQRLTGLGAARGEGRRLSGELERPQQQLKSIDASIDLLHAVKEGPPLYAKGSMGIPSSDYANQIQTASDKWYTMRVAARELGKITPDESSKNDHATALAILAAWEDYWWATKEDLEKAQLVGTAGFDPGLRPKPQAVPDLAAFTSTEFDKSKLEIQSSSADTPPAAPPPTVPVPKIGKTDFDAEIKAADAKWTAMLKAQWQFEAIKSPTSKQTEALSLIKEWKSYWFGLKFGLEKAKADNENDFDPASTTPTNRPDLSALKTAATAEVTEAEKLLDAHTKNVLAPIEQDMKKCLPLLDAPENNPERVEVGGALQMLEKINSEIENAEGAPSNKMLAAKAGALAYLERTLFGWNDRRTRQNLPPSGEAVALADMLQVEHRKMIDHVVKNKLPLPIADITAMDPEEEQALQASWTRLCDGSGTLKIPASYDPTSTEKGANKTPEEGEQFRSETLANFARLLAAPSGRKLVQELEASGKEIRFEASDSAACLATGGGKGVSRPKLVSGDEATTEEEARAHKGTGSGSTVFMVRGAKDSDVALCTQAGGQLHAPRFIAMGHEMVHALHNARGIDRDQVTLTDDPAWNNSEELQTIRKGKLSEQTLRAQYGMSAERFGHKHTEPGQKVADAFATALDVAADDKTPESRGFANFETLAKATQIAISDASPELKGPLPTGWDANQLNVEQMAVILAKSLPPGLKTLGWSPFDLAPPGPGEKIDDVIIEKRYHPRSPQGLRFRSLGGEESLKAITAFRQTTGVSVGDWNDAVWPSKLAALEAAESWVAAFCDGKSGEIGKIASDKSKLATKLPRLAGLLTLSNTDLAGDKTAADAAKFAALGGLQAMARIHQLNIVLKTSLPEAKTDLPTMLDALDKAGRWLDAFATEIDKIPSREADPLMHIIVSSIRGGGSLAPILGDVVMCCRRGRAEVPDYLAAAVLEANKAL